MSRLAKTLDNKYMFGDVISREPFWTVYKGLDLNDGDFVMIKQIPLEIIPEKELNSIMQEIDLLKDLNHKNIVKYRGSLKTKTHLHIILEYVENGTLANIIMPSKFGPLPESLVAAYIAQVLEGLVYLHEQGVIHRDIKGANIFTTKEGLVKLADFGVATKLNADLDTGVVGTPYWMAPEVIKMCGACAASDIWSVGCTVIELLTCVPPYYDLQPMRALFQIVQDVEPPIPHGLSADITDFLHQCFKKDSMQRPDAKTLLLHPFIQNFRRTLQSSLQQTEGSVRVSGDRGDEASTSARSQGDIILFDGGKNNLTEELEARMAQTHMENESGQRNDELGLDRDSINEMIDSLVFNKNLQCQNIAHLQPNQSGSRGLEPCCHNEDSEDKISEGGQAEPKDESRISNLRDKWSSLEVLYSDIKVATNNLCESSEVGKGGYGTVYKGKLGGKMMAIKILDSTSKQGQQEFFQELEVLYGMRHPNLVSLTGACFEIHALVYEFLPHGSLEDCLKYNPNLLTWQMRTRIISEICSALTYLHSNSVVHGDLKPANILLDANFKSKLSDFGLCRVLPEDMTIVAYLETVPKGTSGYIDPWFMETWILRPGSDLYSLGITILKLLTGMKPVGLGIKVRDADETSLRKMIDPTAGSWPFEMAKELAYWSLQCCYHNEKSSKLLEDMSICLEDMLVEIETLEGRFQT